MIIFVDFEVTRNNIICIVAMCDNGFSALNSKMGTTALRERLARSNSLPAAEELVTGSKAPSDLLQQIALLILTPYTIASCNQGTK